MEDLFTLNLPNWPILDQLRLEEALLRTDQRNWCLINQGSSPAIVMGISGKAERLVHPDSPLPVIRRFSGGGTVVIDANTLLVTLICNRSALSIEPYPEPILRWMASLYSPLFSQGFALSENDFTLHGKKFAGHAQYLSKDRWLHHSTILYDYDDQTMDYLLLPERQPKYRQNRPHRDFVCRLNEHLADPSLLFQGLLEQLTNHFTLVEASDLDVHGILNRPHRKATRVESPCLSRF